jgi:hypothetical protein
LFVAGFFFGCAQESCASVSGLNRKEKRRRKKEEKEGKVQKRKRRKFKRQTDINTDKMQRKKKKMKREEKEEEKNSAARGARGKCGEGESGVDAGVRGGGSRVCRGVFGALWKRGLHPQRGQSQLTPFFPLFLFVPGRAKAQERKKERKTRKTKENDKTSCSFLLDERKMEKMEN